MSHSYTLTDEEKEVIDELRDKQPTNELTDEDVDVRIFKDLLYEKWESDKRLLILKKKLLALYHEMDSRRR